MPKADPHEYKTMIDGVDVELESGVRFRFACCDCGLVHDMAIVAQDNKPVSFAVRRDPAATAERRREIGTDAAGPVLRAAHKALSSLVWVREYRDRSRQPPGMTAAEGHAYARRKRDAWRLARGAHHRLARLLGLPVTQSGIEPLAAPAVSFAHQIAALPRGIPSTTSDPIEAYGDGHEEAMLAAMAVARRADARIQELTELLADQRAQQRDPTTVGELSHE